MFGPKDISTNKGVHTNRNAETNIVVETNRVFRKTKGIVSTYKFNLTNELFCINRVVLKTK